MTKTMTELVSNPKIRLHSVDHIEFYVGNAKQSMYFLCKGLGFQPVAFSGLETGVRDKASYLLKQNNLNFVVTSSLIEDSEISEFVKKHGDGVKDIALRVYDVKETYEEAVKAGAIPIMPPTEYKDEHGSLKKAIIGTYGDTIHSLIERTDYNGIFLPNFVSYLSGSTDIDDKNYFYAFDHIVGNVEQMDEWTSYYSRVLGFEQLQQFDDEDVNTEYSALMSVVMDFDGLIKFPINEPATGRRKSQIQEYLDFNNGPGVQHIALLTNDIIETVTELKKNGIEFLRTPNNYYSNLEQRVGAIDKETEKLKELGILVDRDVNGYMFQIFTKPMGDRPTLFYEIIERRGSTGFGKGNFKALFEAIEREQELRGNI